MKLYKWLMPIVALPIILGGGVGFYRLGHNSGYHTGYQSGFRKAREIPIKLRIVRGADGKIEEFYLCFQNDEGKYARSTRYAAKRPEALNYDACLGSSETTY